MRNTILKEISIHLPESTTNSLTRRGIVSLLTDQAFTKSEYYLSRCKMMEQRYCENFEVFKRKVDESADEVFGEWDDLMEWEAYELAYKEWKLKYEELKSVQDIET